MKASQMTVKSASIYVTPSLSARRAKILISNGGACGFCPRVLGRPPPPFVTHARDGLLAHARAPELLATLVRPRLTSESGGLTCVRLLKRATRVSGVDLKRF